ncbi:hypothetical protein [Pseudokineococcus sp. 1T1Z-3]|uniref:hypothetical protein n=1 Tax=Pseudokineococcus sp. 1T1Z-3 TaxID=3132745 RepID=UPI0030B60213
MSGRHADRLRSYGVHEVVGHLDLSPDPARAGAPFDALPGRVRCSARGLGPGRPRRARQ